MDFTPILLLGLAFFIPAGFLLWLYTKKPELAVGIFIAILLSLAVYEATVEKINSEFGVGPGDGY